MFRVVLLSVARKWRLPISLCLLVSFFFPMLKVSSRVRRNDNSRSCVLFARKVAHTLLCKSLNTESVLKLSSTPIITLVSTTSWSVLKMLVSKTVFFVIGLSLSLLSVLLKVCCIFRSLMPICLMFAQKAFAIKMLK